jgi:hypothetical protein
MMMICVVVVVVAKGYNVHAGRQRSQRHCRLCQCHSGITLHYDWERFVIDLGGADLSDVTHRFGFSVNGESRQTFYLKEMAYH